MSQTSNIVFYFLITVVLFMLLPLFRFAIPGVFAAQQHQHHRPNSWWTYVFWIADVLRQPLSVFSQRGNLATIFAIFQTLIMLLYGSIMLISVTILIPTYYFGTDASWTINYLTIWSKLSINHLEPSSLMNLVPICMIVVFTALMGFFYQQF